MREEVHSPDIAILTASDDDVVCDWNQAIHCVRVAGELVTVQPILTPEKKKLRKVYKYSQNYATARTC